MLENVYEGLNAGPKVYLSKEYFCEMYPTCVSSKLCEFISFSVFGEDFYASVGIPGRKLKLMRNSPALLLNNFKFHNSPAPKLFHNSNSQFSFTGSKTISNFTIHWWRAATGAWGTFSCLACWCKSYWMILCFNKNVFLFLQFLHTSF